MPSPSHRVPDFNDVPDIATAKELARAAHRDAKRRQAAPPLLCDRWFADMLVAIDGAPAPVQAIMARRTETLFRLLIDRLRWINRET